MTKHIPVEGKSEFYRDSESTAIINKDKKAYVAYMERKKSVESKNNELNQMKEESHLMRKSLEQACIKHWKKDQSLPIK